MGQMTTLLADLQSRLIQVVRDPASDLTGAAFLLAAVVVVVLIILLLALIMIMAPDTSQSGSKRTERPGGVAGSRAQTGLRKSRIQIPVGYVAAGVVLAFLATAAIAASHAGDSPACVGCHLQISGVTEGWMADTHSEVQCLDCHADPGLLGRAAGLTQYGRWLIGDDPDAPLGRAFVSDASCLGCHASVSNGIIESVNLRVRHQDFLERFECVECHTSVGHGELIAPAAGAMSRCLLCHDGETAAVACESCHLEDVSRVAGTPPERFPKVEMGPPQDCEGCHELDTCDACHGLRMPHTKDFMAWGHGREAAWGNTETCETCHSYDVFCGRCHDFPGHAAGWRTEHGRHARSNKGGCLTCHAKSDHDFCAICHDE